MGSYKTWALFLYGGDLLGNGEIAGDFNNLNIKYFCRQFRFKQLINATIRGAATLDFVIT